MTGWRHTPLRAFVNDIDEGLNVIMDRAKAETGRQTELDFRRFAIAFCDALRQIEEDEQTGVSWFVASDTVSALVPERLRSAGIAAFWRQRLCEIDMEAVIHFADISGEPVDHKRFAPAGLYEPYAAWRLAALEDGWYEHVGGVWAPQVQGGPHDPKTGQIVQRFDRLEGDRTILLMKDDITVWLMDRDLIDPNGKIFNREIKTEGWFMGGSRGFRVPEVYDMAEIDRLRGVCLRCGADVGTARITRVGFAGAYCQNCTPQEKARQEFPGWYN